MESYILVQNIKCHGCATMIKNKLTELNGIKDIQIDVDTGKVNFNYDNYEDLINVKKILKLLGYPEFDESNSLLTKVKSFVSCATGKFANHEK